MPVSTGGHSQQLEGSRLWTSTAWLPELPYPLNWIPQSALRASDNVCANVQTSEHNTNTGIAWGSCQLSVTKEISTQHQHWESRHEIILCSGLRTAQGFFSTEFHMLGGYKPLFPPAVERLATFFV